MNSLQLFFLSLLLVLSIGCEPDPCEDVQCGSGACVEGSCHCPDGYLGVNCEIELCFGVVCSNGVCDPLTESCNCDPNYYGEGCNVLCVNGEFENGACNCSEGYEGLTCETEIRARLLKAWDADEWTSAPDLGEAAVPGQLPGIIRFKEGFSILEVELYTSDRYSGIMLLNSNERILGTIRGNTINFELQDLTTEGTVYGSAIWDDRLLSMELYFFNPTTELTEVAIGTFIKH